MYVRTHSECTSKMVANMRRRQRRWRRQCGTCLAAESESTNTDDTAFLLPSFAIRHVYAADL